jgi:hypothetical protein
MECPHCKYEDQGKIEDGNWVQSLKKNGDHFVIETEETEVSRDDYGYPNRIQPDIYARRGWGYKEARHSVFACAACGILFISR